MRPRRGLAAVIATALLVVQVTTVAASVGPPTATSGGRGAAPIEDDFQRDLKAGTAERMVVEFKARADLKPAGKVKDRTKRGQAVLNALVATANGSQKAAKAATAATDGVTATSYWLTNVLVVEGDARTLASLAAKLAKDPKVSAIRAERIYPLIAPIDPTAAILAAAGDPEWGVDKIGADEAWAAGVLGQGIVVANIDTGVDYLHPALVAQYRGNNGDGTFTHDYNWFDPTGICGVAPCDNAAHGTHTMGTIVGGDGPGLFTPDTGVAPGAEWIAAKGCEDLGCSESSLLGSGQFVLAPTDVAGNDPDPSRRPDIVSNSWGSGPGDTFYLETVHAWRVAGIIPVFASGNPGPFCGEGGSPGDYLESFSVGATDDDDLIADFSGRGPSTFGKVHPDVTAPGVDVVSTVPGGGYQAFSGTSMATPHVAGALALILSADETLRGDFAGATSVLRQTAIDRLDDTCGGDADGDPNNVYGDGRIDAAAAVTLVATGGTLTGTITDSTTDDPIAGARLTANDGTRDFTAVTGADGTFELLLAAGSYQVSATAFGYYTSSPATVVIETDKTTTEDIALKLLPRFTLSGTVTAAEDGSPLAGVAIRAVGTPVSPTTTDSKGAYALELPIGTFMIRASADGCTETGTADISSDGPDVTQDFVLFRKLDDFGHACAPTAFDWVDAEGQTALFGDEIAGRLRLPFTFDFYGEPYDAVFLSDNGYLNFLAADINNFFPSTIPSAALPNAAIYPLWMDLYITEVGSIDAQAVGDAYVIEFSQVRVLGSSTLLDFEVKLWKDGTIDLLYGSNSANPGDGRLATIGIENETGTDALQIGFFEPNLDANQAIRITRVPTGLVTGTVTDANSGLPIAGAAVRATPGGRRALTAADGTYTLRLLPGSYSLTASKRLYISDSAVASVVDGGTTVRDFSLAAPTAAVSPTEVDASVEFGSTTAVEVTLSNGGSAPLTWETRERDKGVVTPPLPRVDRTVKWVPGWHRQVLPRTFPRVNADAIGSADLTTIIVDPTGDGRGSIDVETVRGGSDGSTVVSMALDYSPSTPITQTAGYIFLDIDEDPTTGVPAPDIAGLATQDVGIEFFLDLFATHDAEPVALVVDAASFEVVAAIPVTFDGQSMLVDIPLEALAGDDGRIATAMVLGDFSSPSDWAPDVGHGTIEPFSDASWLSPAPASGEIAAGADAVITLTLGGATVAPGAYSGTLVILTNAPTAQQLSIDIALDVSLPAGFGQVDGFVLDAHTFEPIAGATLTMHAEWPAGTPLDLVATTDATGAYTIIGPDGVWPIDVTLAGYVPIELELEIVGGAARAGGDLELHRIQPHAVLGGDVEPVLLLPPGRTKNVTVILGDPEGHAALNFTVGEVDLGPAVALAGGQGRRSLPAGIDPNARSTRGLGGAADGTAVPPRIAADGDIVNSWPSGLTLPWGVAFSGDVWLGDPVDLIDVRFATDGTRQSDIPMDGLAEWGADMAYDTARGLIWQVNVGGDNGIYGLDPADGSVEHVITGSPWDDISQRGLAYDPVADVFYIGGWNEGIIYRVAGLSHDTPGATLSQCSPPDPNISGLAWNGSFGLLWAATNSESDTIWLVDPVTCDASRAIAHPDGGGGGGAGLELDRVGNLWTVGQNSGFAYLIESGLPSFSDVSWLTVGTTEGTVAPDGTVNLGLSVDTTGLVPGVYRAIVAVLNDDPDNSVMQVPVTLVVPAFQRGVNAGGSRYVDRDGDVYLADRPWVARIREGIPFVGPYGYEGPGTVRTTTAGIRGTTEDGRYKNQREGMEAYRFTVTPGAYQVELSFAELQFQDSGDRVFDVFIEGERVLRSVDVVDESGSWRRALDLTFIVFAEDGVLDIEFDAPRGHKAIVNAVFISQLPEGSPGT